MSISLRGKNKNVFMKGGLKKDEVKKEGASVILSN